MDDRPPIESDRMTATLDRLAHALTLAVATELHADATPERAAFAVEGGRATLTITVSWNPDWAMERGDAP